MHFAPAEPAVDAYVNVDGRAIYAQCVGIAETHPTHMRPFMENAAKEVARHFCLHGDEPPRERGTREQVDWRLRNLTMVAFVGYQARVLSAVDPHVVYRRRDSFDTKKRRNQVSCYSRPRCFALDSINDERKLSKANNRG